MSWGLAPQFGHFPAIIKAGRWCVWKAEKKANGKMTKIPYVVGARSKASTTNPRHWGSYRGAKSTFLAGGYDGIGRLVEPGLVFLDLDHCVDTVEIGSPEDPLVEPWAQEIVDLLDTYTELSPSGTGLRLVLEGALPGPDINNQVRGIEMYGGSTARYVTMTGRVVGEVTGVSPTSNHLTDLYDQYKPEPKPEIDRQDMPGALPEPPDVDVASIYAHYFSSSEDRSHALQVTAKYLFSADYNAEEVLSCLQHCDETWQVALDHRQGRDDKALVYLWDHHVMPASDTPSLANGFDDISSDPGSDLSGSTTPTSNTEPSSGVGSPATHSGSFFTNLDFETIPPRDWVLGHRLLRGYLTATFAPGGVSKSTFALLTAVSVATGINLTGEPVHRMGRVHIINNEDDDVELRRRLQGILIHYGLHLDQVANLSAYSGYTNKQFIVADRLPDGRIASTKQAKDLLHYLRDNNIIYLIVDPFVTTHNVQENDNAEIAQVAHIYRRIANKANCAIEIIHHTSKTGGNSELHAGSADSGRGAGSLKDLARIVITLAKMSSDNAAKYGLDPREARRLVRLDDAKGNFALPDEECTWYRLHSQLIPSGDHVGVHQQYDMEAQMEVARQQKDEAQLHRQMQDASDVALMIPEDDESMKVPALLAGLMSCWKVKDQQARNRLGELLGTGQHLFGETIVGEEAEPRRFELWLECVSDRTRFIHRQWLPNE